MPELSMSTRTSVMLDTRLAVKMFRGMVSPMSIVDYDLTEILSLIINLLSDRRDYERRAEEFVLSYGTYGSFKGEITQDGLILSQGVAFLLGAIDENIKRLQLYTPDGRLPYKFGSLHHGDVLLLPM